MRFPMKQSYNEDIRLFKYRSTFVWYGILVVGCLLLPNILNYHLLSLMNLICIFSIATTGVMLLTGYTGQLSLGHAAFFGIGAYAAAILTAKGVPSLLSIPIAGLIAGIVGIFIGLPALRLSGHNLAIATMGLGFIVEEILVRWESMTHGNAGMLVKPLTLGKLTFRSEPSFFYIAFLFVVVTLLISRNLLRSPTGRAMVAVRDSEVAAQAMGISLPRTKTLAFAISAFFTGVAGSLYAFKLTFISPEYFGIMVSIDFLVMVIVGGLGSLHGAIFGAIFIIYLPQLISLAKGFLPEFMNVQSGIEAGLYGLMIMLFILFEPLGLYGRWLKIKYYFEMFPHYKKDTFRREKKYYKAEKH